MITRVTRYSSEVPSARSTRVVFILLVGSLVAVYCLPGSPIALAASPDVAEVLNMVWRLEDSPTNHKSSTAYSYSYNDGLYYYIPQSPQAGYLSLYRLFNGSDYMTSTQAGESGYSTDATLGYLYPAQLDGTTEVTRWFDSSTGDHAIRRSGESMPGYTQQSLPTAGYAYERFGESSSTMLTLSGGGVTIQSNVQAGGAIFSWQHDGKEYVNINDYGRQIQSAYFTSHTDGDSTYWPLLNPTEAGSRWSHVSTAPELRHGSPVAEAYNDGLTQVTKSIPLDFENQQNVGGSYTNPVIYPNARLGKNITLDYNGMGPVARYETTVVVPANTRVGWIEIPTGYLTGDFNRYWTYDAATSTLTEVDPEDGTGVPVDFVPVSGFGGMILSTNNQHDAMGVYAVNTFQGGSAILMRGFDFAGSGASSNPTAFATNKWAVAAAGAGLDASQQYTFTTWVISGSVSDVTAHMDALYASGEKGRAMVMPVDPADLAGDHQMQDIAVYRPSSGQWFGAHNGSAPEYVTSATTTVSPPFGTVTTKPLLGDVNGDGLDDMVRVDISGGNFQWTAGHTALGAGGVGAFSTTTTSSLLPFGNVTGSEGAFLGDVNGDGVDDAIVINSGFNWFANLSGAGTGLGGGASQSSTQWGLAGDIPFVGDFDGDGLEDIAVWRPGGAHWYVKKSGPGGIGTGGQVGPGQFGISTDIPLVGDVNGDGRTDGIIARNDGNGNFQWVVGYADAVGFIDFNNGGGVSNFATFGLSTDTPIVADVNGDGHVDIGVIYDNGSGLYEWLFALTTSDGGLSNFAGASASFGFSPGDIPLIGQLNTSRLLGDFDEDGDLDSDDVATFITVLLSPEAFPSLIMIADINGDGSANGLDIQGFIEAMFES